MEGGGPGHEVHNFCTSHHEKNVARDAMFCEYLKRFRGEEPVSEGSSGLNSYCDPEETIAAHLH